MPIQSKQQPPYYITTPSIFLTTLTDAQIKTLPTTPIEIIPAPGPNKIIIPTLCVCILNFATATAYTNITDASWLLVTEDNTYLTSPARVEALLAGGISAAQQIIPSPGITIGTATFDGFAISEINIALTSYTNSPIYIKDDFGGLSNYTGGNTANTLKIYTHFTTINL